MSDRPQGLFRKVLRIRAQDSPNVRLAEAQLRAGKRPTGEVITPGVITWALYQQRLAQWDQERQQIGLFAEFWEGKEARLFPFAWLELAERRAAKLPPPRARRARAIGVDSAAGGDKTAFAVADEAGLLHLRAEKTSDTTRVVELAEQLGREWNLPPERWWFDYGGGGKQHVDSLRKRGLNANLISFGEAPKARLPSPGAKRRASEDRFAYANRRAQMHGELSILLDPDLEGLPDEPPRFAIPAEHGVVLRPQMRAVPKQFDAKGRLWLPPKEELIKLIGHSPDELDALVLAVHGVSNSAKHTVGGLW